MLNKDQKKQLVIELAEKLKTAKGAVFSSYQGLATRDSQKLRADLRKEGGSHKVVKISLLKRALTKAGIDSSTMNVNLPVAVSISEEDEVAPARIVAAFAKTNENLKILSGVLESKVIDWIQVKMLASLPGKQELRGQLVTVLAGPMRNLAGVLSGNIRQVVYVLNAIKEAKT